MQFGLRYILLFILFVLGRHLCFPASPRYMELADSADFFISHENWPRAEEKIIEALRLEPANFTNSLLFANLGMVQAQQGKLSQSIQSLTLGLNIAPSSTVILNNRAHSYLLIDSINAAIKDLDKSLSLDSLQEWTLNTRAYLYLSDGKTEQARQLFDKIKKEFSENTSVYSGYAALAEHEGKHEEALKNYKIALSNNPNDIEASEAYIMLLIKTGDYPSARQEIREALKINPENGMFYLLRGYLHRLNYRMDEALADKKIAISKGLDPKYVALFIP